MSLMRRASLLWFALAAVYGAAVLVGLFGVSRGSQIGVSVRFDTSGATITRVAPGGMAWEHGLRAGDTLLEVDGEPITVANWRIRGDDAATFMWRSGSSGSEIARLVVERPAFGIAAFIAPAALSVLFAATSTAVFLRARRTPASTGFSYFGLVVAAALILVPATVYWSVAALAFEAFLIHWVPVTFLGFAMAFGRRANPADTRFHRRILLCAAAGALALDLLWVATLTLDPELNGISRVLDIAFLSGGLLLGAAFTAQNYRAATQPSDQERLRIVITGIALAVLPFVILSLVPTVVNYGTEVSPELTALGALFIPLSIGYAFFRTELISYRRVIHRGVAYALMTGAAVVVFGALIVILSNFVDFDRDSAGPVELGLIVTLIVGVVFAPGVRRSAEVVVDKVLYPGPPDYARVVQALTVEAAAAAEQQALIVNVVSGLHRGLRLSYAALLEPNDLIAVAPVSAGSFDRTTGDELQKKVVDARVRPGSSEIVQLSDGSMVLVDRINNEADMSAYLAFGPRTSEEPFNAEDVRLIETVGHLLSTAISKIELLEELRRHADDLRQTYAMLINLQEKERSEIAGFLHDAPLQRVTHVLGGARQAGLNAEMIKTLEETVTELRMISSTLSPSILENLGLIRAVEDLGRQLQRSTRIKVSFSYDGESRLKRFPEAVELNSYRIAQEALNNCRKHSNASSVDITIEVLATELIVRISDDGVGIDAGKKPGFGFRSMHARAEQLGGKLAVSSRGQHTGTTVVAEIPLP